MDTELKAVTDNIQNGILALKTKGEAQEREMQAQQQQINKLGELLEGTKDAAGKEITKSQIAIVKEQMQKQYDEMALQMKKNVHVNVGMVETKDFSTMIKHHKTDLARFKNAGVESKPFLHVKVNPKTFLRKAAVNILESGLTGDVIAPLRLTEIYRDPLRPVHIREFMNMGRMSSNQVLYNTMNTEVDGSATTAEGASAAQSSALFTATEVPARKINTYLNISKEMMEDEDFIIAYLQTQVVGRILMQEDTQVLTGNNTAPNLNGIKNVAAAYTLGVITGTTSANINYYDVLMQAVTQARVSYYVPSHILVHPNDYQTVLTARDTYGRYQFEQNIAAGANGFYIGGALLVANTAVTQGTFYVGDFNLGATLFQRDDLEITFSTENASNFIQGLVTVLVEERLANVIYRPNAFIYGSSFANAIVSGS